MKPAMILFDYGQTLVHERCYDARRGAEALLSAAARNPRGVTAGELVKLMEEVERDILAEFRIPSRGLLPLELPGSAMLRYELQAMGLEFTQSVSELEWIFWDAATPAEAAEYAPELLECLREKGIASGVVSNMVNTGDTLRRRLDLLLPENDFSFVLSSCDYVFRKPHGRLFSLAQRLAGVPAEKIWFCGDNLRCDIFGARGAGMRPFWYTRYRREAAEELPADFLTEITDWRQMIQILEES